MNVFTNEDYYAAELRSARKLQLISMACIFAFLAFSLSINFGLISLPETMMIGVYMLGYVFVLVGFPLWMVGNNKTKRLRATPRPDQQLNAELKGLSNKYTLHHYVPVGGGIVKHLLVTPAGLIVMDSRDDIGRISCQGAGDSDRWKLPGGGFLGRFTNDSLSSGNPTYDLDAAMARADTLLTAIGKPDVPVNGFIVFTRQDDFEANECNRRSIPLNETKDLVKAIVMETESEREGRVNVAELLTTDDRRRLNDRLMPAKTIAPAKPSTQSKASQPRPRP